MTKDSASKKSDDLDAVRAIKNALEGFTNDERARIIRWACESLGLSPAAPAVPVTKPAAPMPALNAAASPGAPASPHSQRDISSFVNQKNPQTDIHLATTIAYYYRFEAPANQRRDEIDADFLREACRLAGRPGKLVRPLGTLNNAHAKGLLDRGSTRGTFVINSVGENLVGMTLPGDGTQPVSRRAGKKRQKRKR